MGRADVIRFLAVEVGHRCGACFGKYDVNLYPNSLPRVEMLPLWDPPVCARIDAPDKYGNTAAHSVVRHFSDLHVLRLLLALYDKGYGRWNSCALYNDPEAHTARAVAAAFPGAVLIQGHYCECQDKLQSSEPTRASLSAQKRLLDLVADKWPKTLDAAELPRFFSSPLHFEPAPKVLHLFASLRSLTSNVSPSSSIIKPALRPAETRTPPPSFSLRTSSFAQRVSPTLSLGSRTAAAPSGSSSESFTELRVKWALTHEYGGDDQLAPSYESAAAVYLRVYLEDAEAAAKLRAVARDEHADLLELVNHHGLTPFTLAANLGNASVFERLWERRARLQWTWGGVRARAFPLDQIDDIGQVSDDFDEQRDGTSVSGSSSTARLASTLRLLLPAPLGSLCLSSRLPRQPTAMEEIVRKNHWHMLEPERKSRLSSSEIKAIGSVALASLSAHKAVNEHPKRRNIKEQTNDFLTRHEKAASLLQVLHERESNTPFPRRSSDGDSDSDDGDDSEDEGLGSSEGVANTACILQQLAERKWTRVYATRFVALGLRRVAVALFAWGALLSRSGLARVQQPLWGRPPAPGPGIEQAAPWLILVLAVLNYVLIAGPLLSVCVHWWVPVAQRALDSVWVAAGGACCGSARVSAKLPETGPSSKHEHSREALLFTAGHGGSFGAYYLFTLIVGGALVAVGATVDLALGWASASILYTVGAFFQTSHLLYFLLGSDAVGPLVVMLGYVAVVEFGKWLAVFLPVIALIAFSMTILDVGAAPGSPDDLVTLPVEAGFVSYFQAHLLRWGLDASFQPAPTVGVLNDPVHGQSSVSPAASSSIFLVLLLFLLFVSCVGLMALLIALMTRAFDIHLSQPRSRWHIERVRACMLLESGMSPRARLHPAQRNRYFIWLPASLGVSSEAREEHRKALRDHADHKLPAANHKALLPDEAAAAALPMRPFFFCQDSYVEPCSFMARVMTRSGLRHNLVPSAKEAALSRGPR